MFQSSVDTSLAVDGISLTGYADDNVRLLATTRYLAAAAYTDKVFRDKAIEMDEDEFRARTPELGIDAGLVVTHCRIARRHKVWRDAALCFVLILVASTGIIGDLLAYAGYP